MADDLLLAQSVSLDARYAGLADEIVFGTLRYRSRRLERPLARSV